MGRVINWIWPLHELKYGTGERMGQRKGKQRARLKETQKYCFCIKAFHFPLGCPLARSPFLPFPREMEEPEMKVPGAERTDPKLERH